MTGVGASDASGKRPGGPARRDAEDRGRRAEQLAVDALIRDGWRILARRARTGAGEVDVVAGRGGTVAFVEVKARRTLADAAAALGPAQRRRLVAAAGILLAENPGWGAEGVRFDVLLVDAAGAVRRIADAFRAEE